MDEVQAAFEAGWKARDLRAEAPQRWTQYNATTDPDVVALLDVPGMMMEDYEDWVDSMGTAAGPGVHDPAARAASMRSHPSNIPNRS